MPPASATTRLVQLGVCVCANGEKKRVSVEKIDAFGKTQDKSYYLCNQDFWDIYNEILKLIIHRQLHDVLEPKWL